jgi:hypothetical protein
MGFINIGNDRNLWLKCFNSHQLKTRQFHNYIIFSCCFSITGTNGKTTTTTMIGLLLNQERTAGKAHLAGNIVRTSDTNDWTFSDLISQLHFGQDWNMQFLRFGH